MKTIIRGVNLEWDVRVSEADGVCDVEYERERDDGDEAMK